MTEFSGRYLKDVVLADSATGLPISSARPLPVSLGTNPAINIGEVSAIYATMPAATAMQTAAVASGNGVSLNVQGYAVAIINVVSSVAMSGGTTVNFEASVDDTTWVAILAHQVGAAGSLASTTTADGDFRINVAGYKSVRARISGYAAGTTTIKGYVTPLAAQPTTVGLAAGTSLIGKVGLDQTTPGTTNAVAPISGQAGVAAGAGAVGATVQRMTLASDDPLVAVMGAKADAKSTATDTTSVSAMSVLKQISASVQQAHTDLVAATPAGQNTIGNIGGLTKEVVVTPTVTATNAYGTNYVVGGLMTLSAAFTSTGTGVLESVCVTCKKVETSGFTLVIFNSNPSNTTWTDAAAAAINASDVSKVRAVIPLSAYSGLGTHTALYATGLGIALAPGATALYAVLIANAALTNQFASTSDIVVNAQFFQDA